jgi:hypothetical protein
MPIGLTISRFGSADDIPPLIHAAVVAAEFRLRIRGTVRTAIHVVSEAIRCLVAAWRLAGWHPGYLESLVLVPISRACCNSLDDYLVFSTVRWLGPH